MASMDDMMGMSFDALREEVAPSSALPTHTQGGPALQLSHAHASFGASPQQQPRQLVMRDHRQELDVYLSGPGAERFARAPGVAKLDGASAAAACSGKNDFILFEALDGAVRAGKRLVLVTPMGAGRGALKGGAQAYLAGSISQWLSEAKTDGAGRPYGETKDEDPTLRKRFTREQMGAVHDFAALDGA